jgi:sulfur relay (sulfurtransferase) DsrC/TusE family protein
LKEEANWHIELGDECAKDKTLLDKLCEKAWFFIMFIRYYKYG